MAAQCRDPVKRRVLRRKAQKARREFDARVGALPRGKVVKKPVVTKFWVNGRANEDREEWCEEARLHCENAMMTNQRRRKYKLSAFEYSDAEVTARLLSKVGKCRSQLTGYFVRAGGCYVANPMARLTVWWWRC